MSANPHYNHIAGGSRERLAALSDGVFAIAMTLLVLDLHAPASAAISSDAALWAAMAQVLPRLLMFLLSFLTLGIFWVGQQTQLNFFARADRHLSWIHLAFLCAVSLMPYTTSVMAEFLPRAPAIIIYWANILALGVALLASWRYARAAGLLADTPQAAAVDHAIERRILIAQGLYAAGAALAFVSGWAALAVILAVQLNYALGISWRPLRARARITPRP